jgi:hypothetical protein
VNITARAAASAMAGAFATYNVDAVGEAIYQRQSQELKDRESAVQSKSALSVLAERLLKALGREPSDEVVNRLSNAIHWAFGTSNGVLYGMLDPRYPTISATLAAPVALALFAFDEFGLTALDLAAPPDRFPAGTHLRAFANHIAYGAVLAVTYRSLTHLRNEASS